MHGQRRQSRQRQSPPCGIAAHIVNSGQRQGDSTRARNHDGLQHSRQTIRPPTIGTAQLGAGSSSALPVASPAAHSGWMHISSPGSGCMHRHTLHAAQWLLGAAAKPGHGHGQARLPPMTMPGQGHTCTFPCIILAWPAQSCFACRESWPAIRRPTCGPWHHLSTGCQLNAGAPSLPTRLPAGACLRARPCCAACTATASWTSPRTSWITCWR